MKLSIIDPPMAPFSLPPVLRSMAAAFSARSLALSLDRATSACCSAMDSERESDEVRALGEEA